MPTGVYLHKKGYKRPPFSEEWKNNISKGQKGMKKPWVSLSIKEKGSRVKGKKWSIESREKRIGKLNPNYKGTTPRVHHVQDRKYKEWRKAVFERDNHTCQICFIKGGYIEAHHIKEWAKYPELRYDVNNGLTVHKKNCHKLAKHIKEIIASTKNNVG